MTRDGIHMKAAKWIQDYNISPNNKPQALNVDDGHKRLYLAKGGLHATHSSSYLLITVLLANIHINVTYLNWLSLHLQLFETFLLSEK